MIGRLSWPIILGAIFLTIGLALIIAIIGYIYNPKPQNIMYMAIVTIGIIFIAFGMMYFMVGIRDRRRIPFPPPLYPISPANVYYQQPIQSQPQVRFCKECKRQIQIDSEFCSYCGVKQVSNISPP